jgi:hypothetical protein
MGLSANRPMLIQGWSNDDARRATRMIVAGSSFDASKGKGRYLMDYRPRRQTPPKP